MTSVRYGYYPGCSMRGTGIAYEESLLTLFQLLGLHLEELPDWNCCGATSYTCIDENLAFLLSARNLAIAQQSGFRELVAPCSACYLCLRKVQDYAQRYPEVAERVRESLSAASLPPLISVKVRHPLEVLFADVEPERIRARVTRHWHGGRVACYYGCQLVRPYGEADQVHNPTRMDQLLQAAGVPTVEFALKTKCCGGSLTGTIHPVGVRLNYILLKEAARKGAKAIATVCPLCQYNLDAYQAEIRAETGEAFDVPILFFTQILGWALGGERRSLGLHRAISGRQTIDEWFPKHPDEVETYV
jgi:heterodisulfide reductase subunit B